MYLIIFFHLLIFQGNGMNPPHSKDTIVIHSPIEIYEMHSGCTFVEVNKYRIYQDGNNLIIEWFGNGDLSSDYKNKFRLRDLFRLRRPTGSHGIFSANLVKVACQIDEEYMVFRDKKRIELELEFYPKITEWINIKIPSLIMSDDGWWHRYESNSYVIKENSELVEYKLINSDFGEFLKSIFEEKD